MNPGCVFFISTTEAAWLFAIHIFQTNLIRKSIEVGIDAKDVARPSISQLTRHSTHNRVIPFIYIRPVPSTKSEETIAHIEPELSPGIPIDIVSIAPFA